MAEPADNPFIAHRLHLDLYHRALSKGLSDERFVALVDEADQQVAEVAGTGFRTTPLQRLPVGDGGVVAKIETANVGGSHKARHLFGLLIGFLVDEASEQSSGRPDLAIASCGNAALGAAVVARSARRSLRVFVPTDADPAVIAELEALGADINVCQRQPGQNGDPCIAGLDTAIAQGATPFTVQGTVCPETIDGARTLGLELADQLDSMGITPGAIYIQIGGGALATAVMDGLARAWPGRRPPRLHPVQAAAAHPYVAGWHRLAPLLFNDLGLADPVDDLRRATSLLTVVDRLDLPSDLAAYGPSSMTPWPSTPHSVASGILDDLTYDWPTLMAHQIKTGGWPILAEEATFVEAAALASRLVTPPPDETGAAGLAGYLQAVQDRGPADEPDGEEVVLLTGVDRAWRG